MLSTLSVTSTFKYRRLQILHSTSYNFPKLKAYLLFLKSIRPKYHWKHRDKSDRMFSTVMLASQWDKYRQNQPDQQDNYSKKMWKEKALGWPNSGLPAPEGNLH